MSQFFELLSYRRILVITTTTVALIVLWSLYSDSGVTGTHTSNNSTKPPVEYNIQVKDSRGQKIEDELLYTGVTEASKIVKIQAEVDGKISKILARQGASVKAGDVIVNIESGNSGVLLQKAASALEQTKVKYDAALALYNRGLSSKLAMISAKTALKDAEAELKHRRLEYDKYFVKAPFDGIIDAIEVEEGDYVSTFNPSSSSIVSSILVLDPMKVVVEVPEHAVQKVRGIKTATVTLSNGDVIEGNIEFLSSIADEKVRSFMMEIKINNKGQVLSGQTVDVSISAGTVLAHCIPRSVLVLSNTGELAVKTIDADNTVVVKPTTIIKETNDCVFVTDLLEEEKVIVMGQGSVLHGEKILKYGSQQ
ncbi:efflux RND transporter periplasmic adaptor subunit [Rickettsiales endosymbiont of Peranema trichophorum]|uniref:efflux RND transporter periplasmic adaptor subunit n=1 Tax=Rickettsiales endosymbiont of Peranema trichophorum TaxID=2486577 RepID=UPI0010230CA4|nr:efflux RND transporter periplasmic adaptor subunit [Rickettsiales endosymbiont of Peranema trichophorum]RZI47323.1 efflux RND transporter periplasmic adaptor subunit [Rickettsiales endosymbiont of Peranema trichophorum]